MIDLHFCLKMGKVTKINGLLCTTGTLFFFSSRGTVFENINLINFLEFKELKEMLLEKKRIVINWEQSLVWWTLIVSVRMNFIQQGQIISKKPGKSVIFMNILFVSMNIWTKAYNECWVMLPFWIFMSRVHFFSLHLKQQ